MPVNPEYQCVCFRAGFLQMQPSENMMKALDDAGFLSDSSVSMGMKADDNLRLLDYSSAYSNFRPWKISNIEICNNDEAGKIFEFPILSYSTGIINKVINKITKIAGGINIRDLISYFMARYGKGMPSDDKILFSEKLKVIFNQEWGYADFCLKNPGALIKQIKMVIANCKKNNDYNYVPIVLIGHSKDFFFANNLSLFLKACQNIEEVEFTTYFEAVKKTMTETNEKSIKII